MDTLWAVLLKPCGTEAARVPLSGSVDRGSLPLRDLAREGLRHDAGAIVIVRAAADASCAPDALERRAIETARQTLGAIGLRLHDYILWWDTRSVSLRASGLL